MGNPTDVAWSARCEAARKEDHMSTHPTSAAVPPLMRIQFQRLRATAGHRLTVIPRIVAGVPLLAIGLVHIVAPDFGMRPLVEAAGIPFGAVVSPVAVGFEVVAALSLLLGLWARVGALLAIPTMTGAAYAHLAIGDWPNGAENEPPLALPIVVALAAAFVLWRGAGRWSLDARATRPSR
jgi:putative oxidoreductase